MSIKTPLKWACLAAVLVVSACAPSTKYTWRGYENALYDYYKDPTKSEVYRAELAEIVDRASEKRPVPPGIYAELGHMELKNGNTDAALRYFNLERRTWPTSDAFMSRIIHSVEGGPVDPAAETGSDTEADEAPAGDPTT